MDNIDSLALGGALESIFNVGEYSMESTFQKNILEALMLGSYSLLEKVCIYICDYFMQNITHIISDIDSM